MSAALLREASDGKYYATVASDIACYAVSQTIGNNIARMARRIYVGAAGDLHLISASGSDVFMFGVPAGSVVDIETAIIKSDTTTATKITVFW